MIIDRHPSRHPRQGPSCLLMLSILGLIIAGILLFPRRQQLLDVVLPDPTPEPTRSAATFAAKAKLQERDGEFEAAIASYESSIQIGPAQPEIYMSLARLLIRNGQPETALQRLESAAELTPENDELYTIWAAAHIENAYALQDKGASDTDLDLEFQKAVDQAEKAIELNPNSAEAYAIQAAAWTSIDPRWWENANESAKLALDLGNDNPEVHRYLGTVSENQGFYNQAIEHYELALDMLDSDPPDILINLAWNFKAIDSTQKAILTFGDVLDIDTNNADAYYGRGRMYFLIGEYNKAEEDFFEAYQLEPETVRIRAHLGATRFRQFNYEGDSGALPHLEWAVEQYSEVTPNTALYFNMLGLAYFYTEGECSEAQPIFEQVLEAVPDEPNAIFGLELCRDAALN